MKSADPAILDFVSVKEGLSLHEVDSMLNKQSGLLGVSGLTADMRERSIVWDAPWIGSTRMM